MGYLLRKRGDYQGAILGYSQALERQPGHFSALFNRGFCHDKVAPHASHRQGQLASQRHTTGSRTVASGCRYFMVNAALPVILTCRHAAKRSTEKA